MKAILSKYKVSQGRNGSTVAYYTATDKDGNRAKVIMDGSWTDTIKQGHEAAVRALCTKMKWSGDLVRGTLCGVGEVWVWAEGFNRTTGNRIRV